MGNRLIRTTILAAGVTVAMLAASTTAHAAGPGGWEPVPDDWTAANCATAALTGTSTHDGYLFVHGETTLCGSHTPESRSAFVFFDPASQRARVHRQNMRPYSSSGARPSAVDVPRSAGAVGVCVMGHYTWRMACAEITRAADGAVTLRQIDPADPLVAAAVDRHVYETEVPACGYCF